MRTTTFTESTIRTNPKFRSLLSALKAADTIDELEVLLLDIGTLYELEAWSDRIEIARELHKGHTYREIAERLGTSTATVTRIAKALRKKGGGLSCLLGESDTSITREGIQKAGALRKYLG